jgi:hypothetical protein
MVPARAGRHRYRIPFPMFRVPFSVFRIPFSVFDTDNGFAAR